MAIEDYIVSSDQELIRHAVEGDSMAFEHLFNRYRDAVYQIYMQRTGGNADDADDLLQETFIKVYLNLTRYSPEYTFGQWIYTISRNTFVDYLRKRHDTLSLDGLPAGHVPVSPSSPNPEESFINQQQRTQLDTHLEMMTPRYRELIELRFFRQYSYEEIARKLGLPLGTVKVQIHRAREQLCRSITNNSDILK